MLVKKNLNYLNSNFFFTFCFCFDVFGTGKFETDLKRSSESEETWWCWLQTHQMLPPGPQLETEAHSLSVAFWQFSVKGIFEQCIYMHVHDLYLYQTHITSKLCNKKSCPWYRRNFRTKLSFSQNL